MIIFCKHLTQEKFEVWALDYALVWDVVWIVATYINLFAIKHG
jgi:uncharacterized membrane protein YhdT